MEGKKKKALKEAISDAVSGYAVVVLALVCFVVALMVVIALTRLVAGLSLVSNPSSSAQSSSVQPSNTQPLGAQLPSAQPSSTQSSSIQPSSTQLASAQTNGDRKIGANDHVAATFFL